MAELESRKSIEKEFVIDIGKKIREARKNANLSIKALGELSGMSPAAIQKIETNHMVPTIITLMKISRALGRRVSFFIQAESNVNRISLIKKQSREKFYSKESKCFHEYIVGNLEDGILEGGIFSAEPGGASGKTLNSHPGEEIIMCLKGKIEIQVSEESYHLYSGDTLHFKSDIPHRWWNAGKSESQILWIYTQNSS